MSSSGIKWHNVGAMSSILQCNSMSPGNRQAVALGVGTRGEISERVQQRGGGGIVIGSIFPIVQGIPGGRGGTGIGLYRG